jgi:4-alpha-glucanotransferase
LNGKPSSDALVDLLAERFHVLPAYLDVHGQRKETTSGVKRRILNALGIRTESVDAMEAALEAHDGDYRSRMTEPVLVVRQGSQPEYLEFSLKLGHRAAFRFEIDIRNDSGYEKRLAYEPFQVILLNEEIADGEVFGRYAVPFPSHLELGYYTFHLRAVSGNMERRHSLRVIICPSQVYVPPGLRGEAHLAGLWVALYGIRSARNWGIGDLGDLKRLGAWAAHELEVSFIGINPLHSLLNRSPLYISPYSPVSRLYRNFIYLDVPAMADYQDSVRAQGVVEGHETQRLIQDLRSLDKVDYDRVSRLKFEILSLVFEDFLSKNWNSRVPSTLLGEGLKDYVEREGLFLENYATFIALERNLREQNPALCTWDQWPEEYRDPTSAAVKRFREEHWKEILFEKYLQWQLEMQLDDTDYFLREQGIPLGIYHDLAMADDLYSAEYWANQEYFLSSVTMGAPPDDFSPRGQNWGFPAPDMKKIREQGYAFFIRELRSNCRFGGCLRMDHVMKLFHHFWIVRGMEPKDGAYVAVPHDDLLGILALESVRNRTLIIGEDLGTVQPYVRQALSEHGVFSYRLLYFEKGPSGDFSPPSSYPAAALAAISTHDLPTLSGYWLGLDIEERRKLGVFSDTSGYEVALHERRKDKEKLLVVLKEQNLLPPSTPTDPNAFPELTEILHRAIVGFLARCRAKLILLNQEDLFNDTRQQNMPGTGSERRNWATRMRFSVEDLFENKEVAQFSAMYRTWILDTDRSPGSKDRLA